jgi:hypothetical protein
MIVVAPSYNKTARPRKAGKLPPVVRLRCDTCPRNHLGKHGGICPRCWEKATEEGRKARRDRVAKSRHNKKQQSQNKP